MDTADATKVAGRIDMLDGWRAVSILSVMAGHWLPLGPKSWMLNAVAAGTGMALFFILSGFLITQLLLRDDRVVPFLIRRLFRILPLVWIAMVVLALGFPGNREFLVANLAFYANLPPSQLMEGGNHLWSLCVEVQFYVAVALIVGLAGRRGLYVLPVLMVAVTGLRIHAGEFVSIVTWHRIDEILAGCTLALVVHRFGPELAARRLPAWLPIVLGLALLPASHPLLADWNYLRPYLAAAAIGTSLYAAPQWLRGVLTSAPMRYVAEISYALYVVHGMLTATWLGGTQVSTFERYMRRPLLIAATFLVAHVSTFYYEQRFTQLGKRLAKHVTEGTRRAPAAPEAGGTLT